MLITSTCFDSSSGIDGLPGPDRHRQWQRRVERQETQERRSQTRAASSLIYCSSAIQVPLPVPLPSGMGAWICQTPFIV